MIGVDLIVGDLVEEEEDLEEDMEDVEGRALLLWVLLLGCRIKCLDLFKSFFVAFCFYNLEVLQLDLKIMINH